MFRWNRFSRPFRWYMFSAIWSADLQVRVDKEPDLASLTRTWRSALQSFSGFEALNTCFSAAKHITAKDKLLVTKRPK